MKSHFISFLIEVYFAILVAFQSAFIVILMRKLLLPWLIIALSAIIIFHSCIPEEEEIFYPNFASISIQSVGNQSKPLFQISGDIDQIKGGVTLSDYGITFTNNGSLLIPPSSITLDDADYTLSLGTTNSTGPYSIEVDMNSGDFGLLSQNGAGSSTNFSYRAYASFENKTVYSIVSSFNYSPLVTVSFAANGILAGVDRARIEIDLGSDRSVVSEYGVCWSDINTIPTIESSNTEIGDFTSGKEGEIAIAVNLSSLEKSKKYYVRAYAKDNSSNVYYSTVSEFTTASLGWQFGPENFTTIEDGNGMVGFSIGNKGYFGLGSISSQANLKFWQYDLATDEISEIASFPGEGREFPISFTINGKGYIGLGISVDTKMLLVDFWQYDPTLDSWMQLMDFTGETRYPFSPFGGYPCVFATSGYGYVGLGVDANREFVSSIMKYDPVLNSWMPIAAYPEGGVHDLMSGSVGNMGIVGLGDNEINPGSSSGNFDTFWGYEEANDNWDPLPELTVRPDSYIGYKVSDRQFLLGTVNGVILPIHVEYDATSNMWVSRSIPFLLASDPNYLSSESIALFSLDDRVVFFDYGEGKSLEFVPGD